MNDLASTFVIGLIGMGVFHVWKKLLKENRQNAQDRLSPQPLPVTHTPFMMDGDTQGLEKRHKEQESTRQDGKSQDKPQEEASKERTAMEMCLEFLHEYNCDVKFSESNENLCLVVFQGGNFYMNAWNDRVIQVDYSEFLSVPLDQYDEISRIRKAINYVNMYDFFTLYYTIDEERQYLSVSSTQATVLPPAMKDTSKYLFSILTGCFEAARRFVDTLDAIRQEEKKEK